MAVSNQDKPAKRPLAFVALGIALVALAAYLAFDVKQQRSTIAPEPSAYNFSTTQSVSTNVNYNDSSFFKSGPGPYNTTYVTVLTDTIDANFHYAYRSNEVTNLRYKYTVNAQVRSTYASGGDSEKTSNVWSQNFKLIDPVSATRNTRSFSVNPEVSIPYAEYRNLIEQFKVALSLPVNNEVVVTFSINVAGEVGGTPFSDTKTASVTAPLDNQLYQLGVKYTKANQQSVLPQKSQRIEDILAKYEALVAIFFGFAGCAAIIYGFRRQIFKSPYQRELEKIYRYHDGLIIRASRPANLANKNIVTVESFEDILNIEEQIKAPIIASRISNTATQFLITRDDIVYVYTLGEASKEDKQVPPPTGGAGSSDSQASLPQHKRPVVKHRVSG